VERGACDAVASALPLSRCARFRDNAGAHSRTENPMAARIATFAFIGCLLLAGCSVMQPRVERAAKRLDCDGSRDCTVVVTVTCARFYGCDMAVDYDMVAVSGRGGSTDIRWVLRGEPCVEFAAYGIALDSSDFECRPEGNDNFACTDKHAGFGIFKYAINVTVKDSAFGPRGVPSLDPWIVNN
jgi:hypothetical protein